MKDCDQAFLCVVEKTFSLLKCVLFPREIVSLLSVETYGFYLNVFPALALLKTVFWGEMKEGCSEILSNRPLLAKGGGGNGPVCFGN